MKRELNQTTVIVIIAVVVAIVVGIYFMKGSGAAGGTATDQAATLKEIKPRENSPSVPPGGAIPGVAGPAGLK